MWENKNLCFAFYLSDVMGKRYPPWCPPRLSSLLSTFVLSSVHHADSSAQWPLSALSSPHPGPERVPPIRSRQRNAWKTLTAVAAIKPLSFPWRHRGCDKLRKSHYLRRPPSVRFLKYPWQAEKNKQLCNNNNYNSNNSNNATVHRRKPWLWISVQAVCSEAAGFD